MKHPKWTLLYNIDGKWVGTGWEFFDKEHEASDRYDELNKHGHCCTKRPFHEKTDRPHMGACHRLLPL